MTKNSNSVLKAFQRRNMRYQAYQMLSFLDDGTLENLHRCLDHSSHNSYLKKLVQALILTKKYLNKVDRSIYYYFYQENFIKQLDYMNTIQLVQRNSTICSTVLKQYNNLFTLLKTKCLMSQQQVQKITAILCDSDLALPNNLRQNVGKYCNSPYQFYLCSILTPNIYGDFDLQTQFNSFKTIIASKQQIYLKQILKCRNNFSEQQKQSIQKILKIRLNPLENTETVSLIIEDFQLHNVIVALFGLVDQVISTFKLYIKSIENPFNKFVQFNLRYSVFRNLIIQAQQNFGFAFKTYNGIFEDGFNCEMPKGQFSLSKISMNKFKKQMIQEMKQIMPIYTYLTQKARQSFIGQNLSTNNQFQAYIGSPSQQYFMNNEQGLLMGLQQFTEMFVDLSVNQSNINWCGHSQIQMESYNILETEVINSSLAQAVKLYDSGLYHGQELQQMLQKQIKLLQKINIKPVTLRKLCQKLNELSFIQNQGIQIYYNYAQKDNILDYINRSPLRYSKPVQQKQNTMMRSEITDDSSNNNSDNDQWEYNSQSQLELFEQLQNLEMDVQ